MSDPRTDAERRYDAERNGTLYTTNTTDDEILILDWIDEQVREMPAYQMGYGEGYSAGRRDLMAAIRKQLGEPPA